MKAWMLCIVIYWKFGETVKATPNESVYSFPSRRFENVRWEGGLFLNH